MDGDRTGPTAAKALTHSRQMTDLTTGDFAVTANHARPLTGRDVEWKKIGHIRPDAVR